MPTHLYLEKIQSWLKLWTAYLCKHSRPHWPCAGECNLSLSLFIISFATTGTSLDTSFGGKKRSFYLYIEICFGSSPFYCSGLKFNLIQAQQNFFCRCESNTWKQLSVVVRSSHTYPPRDHSPDSLDHWDVPVLSTSLGTSVFSCYISQCAELCFSLWSFQLSRDKKQIYKISK